MLQEAGTSISIQNTFLKNPDLEAKFTARVVADAAAAIGATGKITMSVKGLDDAISKLQSMKANPGADLKMDGYFDGLALLMMMGQPEKTADGKTVYNYVFEIKNDSKTLLNNMNLRPPANAVETPPAPPFKAPAP